MSSKRRRTTSDSKLRPESKGVKRITRPTPRLSEFDTRVTIFEPGPSILGGSASQDKRKVKLAEANEPGEERLTEGDEGVKHNHTGNSRKRVKLEDEAVLIGDLESFAYSAPAIRSKGAKTEKTGLQVEGEDGDDNLPLIANLNATTSSDSRSKSPTKLQTPTKSKGKQVPQALAVPHPAPPNWEETYDTIKAMRSRFVAPVDTMGCAQAQTGESEPRNRRYATLVSLMLSSQTKDEVTNAAIANLRAAFGGSISLEAMIEADEKVISEAISKVGFWRRKTGYVKQAAIKLRDDFNSDVPKTADELCSLPGVGPKMAFLTLQIAWGLNHGIGVDVHVHRITNLLGWHKPPTKNPEQTRLNLQSWLPKDLHYDINHLFVGFGQVICHPVSPRCDVCELSAKGLCPSARKVVTKAKGRKEIVFFDTKGTSAGQEGPEVEIVLEGEVLLTT